MINSRTWTAEEIRRRLLRWLNDNWDPQLSLLEWRRRLVSGGWAAPTWPVDLGGLGLSPAEGLIVADTLEERGVVGPPAGIGMGMAAPTLLVHGSRRVQQTLLPQTATGELLWCQLFSEPEAGSDLAGARTTAHLGDGEWHIRGRKVWTTFAHRADYATLLARTNWDVPKHSGLTYFVLPMRQKGVEVRPLRQANGYSSFNEVLLDDARIPDEYRIGGVDDGWKIALTTLANERHVAHSAPTEIQHVGRVWREAKQEAETLWEPYSWYPQREGRVDLLVPQAHATGTDLDPVVRQELVRALILERLMKLTASRAAAGRPAGSPVGPEGSLHKLASSAVARQAARVHCMMVGPGAMLRGVAGPVGGIVAEIVESAPAGSIAGGTDEIQRNILAEKVLGLPREPNDFTRIPFREVPI